MRIGDLEAGRESKLPYSVRKKMWFGTIRKTKIKEYDRKIGKQFE